MKSLCYWGGGLVCVLHNNENLVSLSKRLVIEREKNALNDSLITFVTAEPEVPVLSKKERAEQEKLEREARIKDENNTLEHILVEFTQATEAAVTAATTAQQTLLEMTRKHMEVMKSAVEEQIEVYTENSYHWITNTNLKSDF